MSTTTTMSSPTRTKILLFILRSMGNIGVLLFTIYTLHIVRRTFGSRPKVLSRQYRGSSSTDYVSRQLQGLKRLAHDVSPSAEARIHRSLTGVGSEEPTTTVARLKLAGAMKPKAVAFMVPDFEAGMSAGMKWNKAMTWEEYVRFSRQMGKALLGMGAKRHDVVLFVSESRPEFFVAYMGVQHVGGICAPAHPWTAPSELAKVCESCNPKFAFVDSVQHVQALKNVPGLSRVVLITPNVEAGETKSEFDRLIASVENEADFELEDYIRGIRPGHGSCILFSSGQSSERQRPILLSHDNVTFSARTMLQHHENVSRWGMRHPLDDSPTAPGEEKNTEHILSFLPLSHVATLALDLHVPMCLTSFKSYGAACTVWTLHKAAKNAQRDTLYPALVSVRPTIFLGMPAVFERFRRAMKLPNSFFLKRAMEMGETWFQAVQAGSHGTEPVGLYYAERFAFLPIKKKLGLDRAKLLMSSGAPIAKEQLEFFGSLGLHVMESFGSTGSSGPQTMGRQDYFVCGKVGVSLPSCELKIVPVSEYPEDDGEGEICVRGRHVCTGILNDPDETNKWLDEDGWFHTNHVGRIDEFGCLELIGRKDELIGVSPPANVKYLHRRKRIGVSVVEAVLRDRARPMFDRVVVVSVITEPKECRLRVFATLRREVLEGDDAIVSTTDKTFLHRVQAAVKSANEYFDGVCFIEEFLVLPPGVNFSAFGDDPELTQTGQARRSVVTRKFQNEYRILVSKGFRSMSQQ